MKNPSVLYLLPSLNEQETAIDIGRIDIVQDRLSPSSATSARGHIVELDGLRGIAIIPVMLHHFWPRGGVLLKWDSVAHLGWIGVDLFFVISGFLLKLPG